MENEGFVSWAGLLVVAAIVGGGYYLSNLFKSPPSNKESINPQISSPPSRAKENENQKVEDEEARAEQKRKEDLRSKQKDLEESKKAREEEMKKSKEQSDALQKEKERLLEEKRRIELEEEKEKERIEEEKRREKERMEFEKKEEEKRRIEEVRIIEDRKKQEELEAEKERNRRIEEKQIEEKKAQEQEERIKSQRRQEEERENERLEQERIEEIKRQEEEERESREIDIRDSIGEGLNELQIPDILASLERREDVSEDSPQFDLSNLNLDQKIVSNETNAFQENVQNEEIFDVSSMPSMRGKKNKKTMKMFEEWSKPNTKNTLMAELGLLSDDSPPDFERKETSFSPDSQETNVKPSRLMDLFRPPTSSDEMEGAIKNELKTTMWSPGMPIVKSYGVREDMNKKGLRRSKKMSMKFGTMTGGVQEDANFAAFPWNGDKNRAIFSVYDGHAGKDCAETAIQRFPEIFKEKITGGEDERDAFLSTFEQLDNELLSFEYEGCTATSLYFWQSGEYRYLQCANVGDSTAFLKREHEVIALSKDHKATDPDERKRIIESGIEFGPHQTRVGGLAVSRALGDHFLKQEKLGVISVPYVSAAIRLEPTDTIVVLASDGLWDIMSGTEAIQFCMNYNDAEDMASELIKKALSNLKCTDNITVIVILL